MECAEGIYSVEGDWIKAVATHERKTNTIFFDNQKLLF